jgi:hypothetical protein
VEWGTLKIPELLKQCETEEIPYLWKNREVPPKSILINDLNTLKTDIYVP